MNISGFIFTLIFALILNDGQSSRLLEANCGTLKIAAQDRIRFGRKANILEHPWMAHISTRKKCSEDPARTCFGQCGGTLITDSFVLTAAHCELFLHRTSVTLGMSNTSNPSEYAIRVQLAEIIIHPGYFVGKSPYNDIALLRLAETVQYSDFIKPVCLTNYRNLFKLPSLIFASGWGFTEHGAVSKVLRRTQLYLYDSSACGSLSSSQICAGSNKSDTCNGDSGGPITGYYYLNGMRRVTQLGIVSYGDSRCEGLGIYTNVMFYYDWIADNIIQRESQIMPAPTQRLTRTKWSYVPNRTPNGYRRPNWHYQ